MKPLIACIRKEMTEQLRGGKLVILGLVFALFGVMNPATAKLTPWLLEMMSESMADSGMTITISPITAMDSWVQFFKNIPMALIVFVLLEGSIFTKEYRSGTLVLSLTKGLRRYQAVVSKTLTLMLLWTAGYWLCFGVTYAYNAYFWDNSIAQSLGFSAVCWWVFGLFTVALSILFSVVTKTGTGVLLGTGGVVFLCYLLGIIPKLKEYLPTRIADGNSLIYGVETAADYGTALAVTAVLSLACLAAAVPIFNKKQL